MEQSTIIEEEPTILVSLSDMTIPLDHPFAQMALVEREDELTIVHGTEAELFAKHISPQLGIDPIHYSKVPANELATGRHLIWGTLHEEEGDRVSYTSLMRLLDIADRVYRATGLCETCGLDKAVLFTVDKKPSCCPCARNRLQKEGPRILLKGELSLSSNGSNATAIIKTPMPGMSRSRSSATPEGALRSALQALVDAEAGPKYTYEISAPRSVPDEILTAAGKGFSVRWV